MSDGVQVEVVIFAKEPVPGRVKTRLQPELSPQESVTLYRAFLRDVLELVGGWCGGRATSRATLAWSGGADDEVFELADDLSMAVVDQGEGDLGARMRRAVEGARGRGAERVIVVGTDSPTLSEEHLDLTLQLLGRCDVVWGPSFDGGYYLVGIATDEASS